MSKEMEARIEELVAQNRRLAAELESKGRLVNRALASYQQRALQMDLERPSPSEARQTEGNRALGMEAAARLRNELLASCSHDVRTPLESIIRYCDDLMREEGSRLTTNGRRDLGTIKVNAKTLLSLIDDILYLSKIEHGRIDVVNEPIEVRRLLGECADTARQLLTGKDVSLEVFVSDEARRASTDSMKLRQIILNLLSNAAKFTDKGTIVLEAIATETDLVFCVEDTGIGIPRDQLAVIFGDFGADAPGTRTLRGGGAGLATVRELAHVLGGTAHVTSTPGRGSRFTISIPRHPDEIATRPGVARINDTKAADASDTADGQDALPASVLRA